MGAPVLGAILVQNFTQWDVVVDTPPIEKLAGADVSSTYLSVDLGTTISNDDSSVDGGTDTLLSHEEISFTCFAGDRTYYTDVIQLSNTDTATWNVNLTVEADIAGDPAVEDTFNAGDADIWLVSSAADTSGAPSLSMPNPATLAANADWNNDYIQLEVVGGVLSALDDTMDIGSILTTEDRQLGLVVDCGANMVDGETGTFRITVGSSPL